MKQNPYRELVEPSFPEGTPTDIPGQGIVTMYDPKDLNTFYERVSLWGENKRLQKRVTQLEKTVSDLLAALKRVD